MSKTHQHFLLGISSFSSVTFTNNSTHSLRYILYTIAVALLDAIVVKPDTFVGATAEYSSIEVAYPAVIWTDIVAIPIFLFSIWRILAVYIDQVTIRVPHRATLVTLGSTPIAQWYELIIFHIGLAR